MLQAEQLVQEQVQLLELELQQELVQVELLELGQVQVQLQAVELELELELVQQLVQELVLELPQLQGLEQGQQLLGLETLHWLERGVLTHLLGRSEETSP